MPAFTRGTARSAVRSWTSGRRDDVLDDLKDPNAIQRERIDFIFVKAPPRCEAVLDPGADADADGLGTGIWDDPVVDGPGGLVFVSDHSGISLDLSCEDAARGGDGT